jgi:outer membrane protein assembly factor BamB
LVAAALVALLVLLGVFGIYSYWRRATLRWAINRGLELLQTADNPLRAASVLDAWENETTSRWQGRRNDLARRLFSEYPLTDPRVRWLLTRVTGADYGQRREDWKEWLETDQRLRAGKQPKVAPKDRVRLEPLWEAPVGLTAWFSTILPLDGQIYLASLGASFGNDRDAADGVVRVDGQSGAAALIFTPPDGGVRDMLGIAAGDNCLFAACRNGFVYCIRPDGQLGWSTRAGGLLASGPMTADLSGGGSLKVLVIRQDGKVLAIDGESGKSLWNSQTPKLGVKSKPGADALCGATLALGPLLNGERDVIATTVDGTVRVLNARNGSARWEEALGSGSLAGAVCGQRDAVGPPAYVADRGARVWTLARSGSSLKLVEGGDLLRWTDDGLIAGLRTIMTAGQPPLLVACPTGAYSGRQAGVCVLQASTLLWRYAPGGAIWATPAIADVNGDGRSEIIVASIDAAEGHASGVVTVLSSDGRSLLRLRLPAPIECSPVVADVNGDGRLELLVADQSGILHCYATDRMGPVEWGLAAGDSHNTRNAENAYRFGQTPSGMQWRWNPQ